MLKQFDRLDLNIAHDGQEEMISIRVVPQPSDLGLTYVATATDAQGTILSTSVAMAAASLAIVAVIDHVLFTLSRA